MCEIVIWEYIRVIKSSIESHVLIINHLKLFLIIIFYLIMMCPHYSDHK
jgi:hypothetical protein